MENSCYILKPIGGYYTLHDSANEFFALTLTLHAKAASAKATFLLLHCWMGNLLQIFSFPHLTYYFKSIQTTSLNELAKGNPTTGLLFVLLYLLQISHLQHFLTQSVNSLKQESSLSLISLDNFSFDTWANWWWSFTAFPSSLLYLNLHGDLYAKLCDNLNFLCQYTN